MLQQIQPSVPVEKYLYQEQGADFKSEYHNGHVYAMAGGSLDHGQFQANLILELGTVLRGKTSRVLTSDGKVGVKTSRNFGRGRTRQGDFITYPDASVICGQPELYNGDRFTVANPVILFEVISPSTRKYDRSIKFEQYLSISSLKMYIMIDSKEIRVDIFERGRVGWRFQPSLTDLDDILKLPPINAKIPLSLLYDRIEFEDSEDEQNRL